MYFQFMIYKFVWQSELLERTEHNLIGVSFLVDGIFPYRKHIEDLEIDHLSEGECLLELCCGSNAAGAKFGRK